jgi:hypothetical protein
MGYRGALDSHGISIMHYPNNIANAQGTVHDITINKIIIKSLGYEPTSNGGFIHIHKGYDNAIYTPYNIHIKNVTLTLDGSGVNSNPMDTYGGVALRFRYLNNPKTGFSNIVIENFVLDKLPKGANDVLIQSSQNITLSDGIIKRLTSGGNTHIRVLDSNYITLNNIQIPQIDTNGDGVPDSNQGYAGLYMQGTTHHITAISCVFKATNKYLYDSTAQSYANTNSLDIT